MKSTLQALVEREDGTYESVTLYTLQRDASAPPSSGLGLFLGETRELCATLQNLAIREQVNELVDAMRRCPACWHPLGLKDQKQVVYRTAFGKCRLPSPRLYSRCAHCGHRVHEAETFSALAMALPERSHPQWVWLQTRFASVMSYSQARRFLSQAFAGALQLPATSIRANVQRIGARLEAETQSRVVPALPCSRSACSAHTPGRRGREVPATRSRIPTRYPARAHRARRTPIADRTGPVTRCRTRSPRRAWDRRGPRNRTSGPNRTGDALQDPGALPPQSTPRRR